LTIKIDPSDFESLKLRVVVKNLTSGTDYLEANETEIDELLDEGIKLRVPARIGAAGHTFMVIFLEDHFKNLPNKLPEDGNIPQAQSVAIGKVLDMEKDGDNGNVYEIKFNQYDTKKWFEVNNKFREKQEEIMKLFERIKYEQVYGNIGK
jgi:hypothetical protein